MPKEKNHPLGGRSPYDLRIRPNVFKPYDFDEVIERHGHNVRWVKAQPCPVLTDYSQHDLNCKICFGRGEIYTYPREYWHYNEQPPHGLKDPIAAQADKVVFFDNPVVDIRQIYKQEADGSRTNYRVVSQDSTSAIIAAPNNAELPLYYEPIYADYSVDLWTPIIATASSDNEIIQLKLEDNQFIAKVNSVKYESNGLPVTVQGFHGNSIYLSAPLNGKAVVVSASTTTYSIMTLMAFESMPGQNWKQYPHSEGDVVALCSVSYKIGLGDILTSMVMSQRLSEVVVRSAGAFDILPFYEVEAIDMPILDVEGNEYLPNRDFILWDYNKIRWNASQPRVGTRYSVTLLERMTWRVHNQLPATYAAQDRVFPQTFHLKKLTKNTPGQVTPGIKTDNSPVGDWSTKFKFQ